MANRNRGKPPNGINDVVALLRDSNNGQAEGILKCLRKFGNIFN